MAKKAILWLILYFVKILDSYQVLCYIKEKGCNETHFELSNTI